MKKIKNWFGRRVPTKRRLIQIYAALLFNANLKGFVSGEIYKGNTKSMCVPGMNCYSCPGAVGACPLGSLQNAIAEAGSTKKFEGLYYVLGILVLFGIFMGRWICGFLCPFGLVQDWIYKIKTPKVKKSKFTRALSYLKYVLLVLFAFVITFSFGLKKMTLPGFCKYICPAGMLEGSMGLLSNEANSSLFAMLGPLFTWKFALFVGMMVAAVFIYRFFCRFVCPLGALYGLFNKVSVFGIKVEKSKCIDCGLCVNKCKMDVHHVGDHECINCGECMSVCPTNAIVWKGSKLVLAGTEITPVESNDAQNEAKNIANAEIKAKKVKMRNKIISIVLVVAMLASLGGALYYYNFVDGKPQDEPVVEETTSTEEGTVDDDGTPAPTVGNEVGNLCISKDIELFDGGVFNVSTSGAKVTIINFWYTSCGPCVKELPDFNRIADEYQGEVMIYAIHAAVGPKQMVPSFIEENFGDFNMDFIKFGWDENSEYYASLNMRDAYPATLIIDENGVIQYKIIGSAHYEDDGDKLGLKSMVENVLNNGK